MPHAAHPPIYAQVVAERFDPFTIDQRYADEIANQPLPPPDTMDRRDLQVELKNRGVTMIAGRRLANTPTAALVAALAAKRRG